MSAYVHENLYVKSVFPSFWLKTLSIFEQANTHGRLSCTGFLDSKEAEEMQFANVSNTEFSLYTVDEDKNVEFIFCGVLQELSINQENGVWTAEVIAGSLTTLLDVFPRCRAFQDADMTYNTIMSLTFDERHTHYFNLDSGRTIEKPLFQYYETNWEFAKRLASHFNSPLYPSSSHRTPHFNIGAPPPGQARELTCDDAFHISISPEYHKLKQVGAYSVRDFASYTITSTVNYNLCEWVKCNSELLMVCEKSAVLKDGIIQFSYKLGRPSLDHTIKAFNEKLRGISLHGRVVNTHKEFVEIALDIDAAGKTYPYLWLPQTGNQFYCMPAVSSVASIHFQEADEHSAIALDIVQEHGDNFPDASFRQLTTEHRRNLLLHPSMTGVSSSNDSLILDDASGIAFQSSSKTVIQAEGSISITAPRVTITAPNKVTALKFS